MTVNYNEEYVKSVSNERPLSEGDQVKIAIRTLFEESRKGYMFTEEEPLKQTIHNVNGHLTATLCLCKHPTKKGAVIMWYE